MAVVAGVGGVILIAVVLWEGFETIILPRRETNISLLDARAGAPPTASEMFRRHGGEPTMESLRLLLQDWEHWSAAVGRKPF